MQKYDPKFIEPKWQKFWEDNQTFRVETDPSKEKFFGLIEFPYPSGAGLHVGHPRGFTAMDIVTRQKRMEGKNVLLPIGFDSFGLPTENYAIKTGRQPAEITAENIANFTRQLKSLGFGFDWSRAVTTSEPEYYKWTQWIFLQLYKHGLAYKANQPINWCPKDKIGLANEEVVDGCCERCGNPVEKRNKEQWMLAITKYADKLLAGLNEVDYITRAKIQQENWIGRSEGVNLRFRIENSDKNIEVFTTRLDTIFSGTFIVLAPENPLVTELTTPENKAVVETYIKESVQMTDIERTDITKEKTGAFIGSYAINSATGDQMPIWISDFVLAQYGTGAVFADAHDTRDFEMAKKFNIPLKVSLRPVDDEVWARVQKLEECFTEEGVLVNSAQFDGLKSAEAREKIYTWLAEKGAAEKKVQYKLRDWVFSRQRYWGEPIPLVFCENCADKKYNVIILHGIESKSSTGFKPWLKLELEKLGHNVWSPELPNTNKPSVDEQARFIRDNAPFKIDEKTILVGHSLGGVVLCRLLETINGTVDRAIFVDSVIKPEFNDVQRPAVTVSCNWEFDWELIRLHVKNTIVLGDNRFSIIKEEHLKEFVKSLDAKLVMVKSVQPHFFTVDGSAYAEPSILQEMLRSERGQIVEFKKSSVWNRLVNGTKTSKGFAYSKNETQPEFKVSGILTFVHGEEMRSAEITKVHQFKSLTELAKVTELHGKLFDTASSLSEAELTKLYSEYNPNYPEYITETGLVVCEFTLQPVKYKGNNGWIPLPESELPLELPKVEKYLPTDTGESPIAAMTEWVKTTCPKCGGPARRETDTMPNWAGSSWYFLRYTDPKNTQELASQENLKYWTSVDWYNGGMEHTVLHLLYSRFWNQFLYDIGVVPTLEPYKKRTSHGMILAKGGEKMSKSKGNVVNPDEMVELYGADALRTYIMFMGPFDQAVEWDTNGLVGVRRFLDKVWNLQEKVSEGAVTNKKVVTQLHQVIKKVTDDIANMSFNTSVAKLMELTNTMTAEEQIAKTDYQNLIKLLSVFAPHVGEELWAGFGDGNSVSKSSWPAYDAELAKDSEVTIAVQVNGKVRAELIVSPEIAEEEIKALALANENIQKWLDGKEPKKVIYVKGRLVSIVV